MHTYILKNGNIITVQQTVNAINNLPKIEPWKGRGAILYDIKKNINKKESHPFTVFIDELSKSLALNISMLWRDIKAYDYYENNLKPKLQINNITILNGVNNKFSTKALDVLEKLEPILPTQKFLTLANDLMQGKESATQAEQIWFSVRKSVTVKGKDIGRQINTDNESLESAALISTITKNLPTWASQQDNFSYSFYNFNKNYILNIENTTYKPSYILITNDQNKNMVFHEIFTSLEDLESIDIKTSLKAFNNIWLILPKDLTSDYLKNKKIPNEVGLLYIEGETVNLIREPFFNKKIKNNPKHSFEITKEILSSQLANDTRVKIKKPKIRF